MITGSLTLDHPRLNWDWAKAADRRQRPDSTAAWHAQTRDRIIEIAKLHRGWDGHGSVAISTLSLEIAFQLLCDTLSGAINPAPPFLVPCPDGSIQVEWHRKDVELELDITSDQAYSIWIRQHDTGIEIYDEGQEAINLFYSWAARVASSTSNAVNVQAADEEKLLLFIE